MNRLKVYIFATSTLTLATLFFILYKFDRFEFLRVPVMSPSFADLRLITSASECAQVSTWSMTSPSCDPWGRPFNYPSVWVDIFSFFNLKEHHTALLGVLELFILSATLSYWLQRVVTSDFAFNKMTQILFFFVFAMSPPILLLAERGNIDILIFAGLTVATIQIRRRWYVISSVLLVLLGTLKIYPFAGVAIPFLTISKWPKRLFVVVSSGIGGLLIIDELKYISERSITTWNSISYGTNLLPQISFQKLHMDDSRVLSGVLGFSLFLSLTLFLRRFFSGYISVLALRILQSDSYKVDFQVFGTIFIFSYFVGTSYDYRLVMTFPLFLVLLSVMVSKQEKVTLGVFLIGVMYGGHLLSPLGSLGIILNSVSDLLILFSTSLLLLILVKVSTSHIEERR